MAASVLKAQALSLGVSFSLPTSSELRTSCPLYPHQARRSNFTIPGLPHALKQRAGRADPRAFIHVSTAVAVVSRQGRGRRDNAVRLVRGSKPAVISSMIPEEVVRTRTRTRTRTNVRARVAAAGIEDVEEAELDMDVERKRPLRPVVERFRIHHEKNVSNERLKELGVSRWSKWFCGPGVTYTWHWKVDELVYISKGSVEVVPDGCTDGAWFYAGDIVRFPKWFEASLTFDEDYEQHYKFLACGDN